MKYQQHNDGVGLVSFKLASIAILATFALTCAGIFGYQHYHQAPEVYPVVLADVDVDDIVDTVDARTREASVLANIIATDDYIQSSLEAAFIGQGQGLGIPDNEMAQIGEEVWEFMARKGFPSYIRALMTETYADQLSAQELRQLVIFYRSPFGQKLIDVNVRQAIQAALTTPEWMAQHEGEILRVILEHTGG